METVSPTGKNLINTQGSYKKCEEKIDTNWSGNNTSIDSWVLRDIHNYSVAILLPVFLALCFLISMLGAVFLFTSFFLITKVYVMEVFVNECNSFLIILIFITNGLHLISTGLTGVMGLGKRRWLLVMHSLLAVVALVTMLISYYFEPRYEAVVMDEVDTNMWLSLSRTHFKYHAGWDYIQRNMQCCGVNGYADWCGCRNGTMGIKKRHIKTKLGNDDIPEPEKKFSTKSSQKLLLHSTTPEIPAAPYLNNFEDRNDPVIPILKKLQVIKKSSLHNHNEYKIIENQEKLSTTEIFFSNNKSGMMATENSLPSKLKEIHPPGHQNMAENPEPLFDNSYEEYGKNSSGPGKQQKNFNDNSKIVLFPKKEKPSPEESFFVVKHVDERNINISSIIPLPSDKYGCPLRYDKNKILTDIRNRNSIIECYIPDSCCIMSNSFPYDEPDPKCKKEKDETGLNDRGCHGPVKQIMRRFISSFTSICKFVIMVMVLDLPLVILMISTN